MEKTKTVLPPDGNVLTEELSSLKNQIRYYHFMLDTTRFIKRALSSMRKVVCGTIYGYEVFIRQEEEADDFKLVIRIYSKVEEHWEETVVTKTTCQKDLPVIFQEKLSESGELDITDYLRIEER